MSLPSAEELVNHIKQSPIFDKWKREITDAFEKTVIAYCKQI